MKKILVVILLLVVSILLFSCNSCKDDKGPNVIVEGPGQAAVDYSEIKK